MLSLRHESNIPNTINIKTVRIFTTEMKKALGGDANTALAVVRQRESKLFAPPQTPFPGARDGKKLISWRWSLPSPTNPVW